MAYTSDQLNLQGADCAELHALGLDGGNIEALTLRMPGEDIGEWISAHRRLLTFAGVVSSAPVLSGCVSQVLESYNNLGVSLNQQLEVLAQKPVEIIVPAALIGATYGVGQTLWWVGSSYVSRALEKRSRETPFEQTDAFNKMHVMAKGVDLVDGNPDKEKALAEFLKMIGLGGKRGQEAGGSLWQEFVKRLKVIPLAELQEWGKSGALAFGALFLMDALERTPDIAGKAGLQIATLGVAWFALQQGWEAIKPFKYQ